MSRILMIHFSPYPIDVRIRREAETLHEAGHSVDTISLKRGDQLREETHSGVMTYRLDVNRSRSTKIKYFLEYISFVFFAFLKSTRLHFQKKYDLIHIHNMPDFLVFSALMAKLTGAKILLDLHDPVPEIYITKYNISNNHPIIKLLVWIEKVSIRFADHVITPNIAFQNTFIKRGCPVNKISVIMNTPMERIFLYNNYSNTFKIREKGEAFDIMYHGTLALRNGSLDILEAINILKNHIPGLKLHLFGEGEIRNQLKGKIGKLKLEKFVTLYGLVPNEQISSAIKEIDLGVIPNQRTPFTDLNLPVRIFEYLAHKKPVIVPKTKGIMDYFDDESIIFFEAGNIQNLADVIFESYKDPHGLIEKTLRGYAVYQKYTWEKQRKELEKIVSGLVS